ncbi:MAG TPA: hypothetical protein VH969_27915 [Actinophytocola sp.]|uniref:hypothetical protein n=1 Tax=Actinophytocola sp. TaxID=1872138 RepID=UPI002F92EB4C
MRGFTPHGLACGLLMAVCAYWTRHWDAPPMLLVALVIPCSALSGFMVARGGVVELGMAAGAATATTGHVITVLAAFLYCATTGAWLASLTWIVLGATFVLLPIVLGATLGAVGAFVSRFVWATRS